MQGATCRKWPSPFAKVATRQMLPSERALRGFQSDPLSSLWLLERQPAFLRSHAQRVKRSESQR